MERFTGKDKLGYYTPRDITLNCLKQRGKSVDRLGAYEDTGLTPDEIDMDHEAAENLRRLCQLCDLDRLEELAKADAAPVRHGHWISADEASEMDRYDLAYCCSVCKQCNWDCTESEDFNFCPNCGARMDLDGKM